MEAEIAAQLTQLAVPGVNAAFVTALRPRAITTIRELRAWYTVIDGPILVHSELNLTGVINPLAELTVELANQDHTAIVVGLRGPMQVGPNLVNSCLMVIGPPVVCTQLGAVPTSCRHRVLL
jgi:hypothetical protein